MKKEYYEKKVNLFDKEIQNKKKLLNLIVFFKLFIFSILIYSLYKYFSDSENIFGLFSFISIVFFIGLNVIDSRLVYKFKILKELRRINKIEISSLNYNFDSLPSGSEYINLDHNYSSDLDLFGNKSLFQFINRTTTQFGKDKLASWLTNTNISSKDIYLRQLAVKELKELISWRQFFKAIGTINNLDSFNLSIIDNWLSRKALFKIKTHLIIHILLGLNIILITTSIFSLTSIIFPLTISVFNLLFVFFSDKKN